MYNKFSFVKKTISLVLAAALMASLSGCGSLDTADISDAFDPYATSASYGIGGKTGTIPGFSANIAVPASDTVANSNVDSALSESSMIVDLSSNEMLCGKNIYERLYPASTTKILTALVVIKNCSNLDETLTVSENALDLESGSSVAGLAVGDVITVRDALYGMMLASGNDAAIALAEYVSGSVSAFADLMNDTARMIGATNSHFVNPNGLQDSEHYTTVYDLYLIFNEAIKNEVFYDIVTAFSHTATYTSGGESVTKTWDSTCRYMAGTATAPEGVTVLGAKTGTTSTAGSCLVLLSENSRGDRFISVALAATERNEVYSLMNQLMSLENTESGDAASGGAK